MTKEERARSIILEVYKTLPSWKVNSVFLAVKMGDCVVYTPTNHIKRDRALLFKAKLEELYIYTQKIIVDKVAEN